MVMLVISLKFFSLKMSSIQFASDRSIFSKIIEGLVSDNHKSVYQLMIADLSYGKFPR